eukprot:TRINITY_DN6854_c0_g1_i3.p1 TRINITY_DN6854_c0_g1~~TRINITY_DN6854_c0_g1_i3.p1  ORF type:complete len:1058 (+),score=247.33 TRINITY_DN6854_c0_g1_i3:1039-4212(+)
MTVSYGAILIVRLLSLQKHKNKEMRNTIGVSTVFIVVLFLSFLQNAVESAPRMFVKLTESRTSEADLAFFPALTNTSSATFINHTAIDLALRQTPSVVGVAPRWTLLGTVGNANTPLVNMTAVILIMNSTKERDIGLGRGWRKRPLGSEECYVSTPLLRSLGVAPDAGQAVRISFGMANFVNSSLFNLTQLAEENPLLAAALAAALIATNNTQLVDQLITEQTVIKAKVIDAVDDAQGKWPASLGNVVVLEADYAQTVLGPLLQLLYNVSAENFRLTDYALQTAVVWRDRQKAYVKDYNAMFGDVLSFSNQVSDALPTDLELTVTAPVAWGMSALVTIRLFLDQIFNMVVIVLVFLGCVLIYSLQVGDVQEKTYEYGMLRALGLQHTALILLLVFQAVAYCVPGIAGAYVVLAVLNVVVAVVFAAIAVIPIDFGIAPIALYVGLGIGIAMPLASNIIPIRRALSKTLRDSLDVYHQANDDVSISVRSLERYGLSPAVTAFAITLTVIGFLVYYIVPMAFTYGDMSTFFLVLILVLLGMVFGFSLLAQVVQPVVERLMLGVMMHGAEKRLKGLVVKHLHAHRSRNRKTAVMFTTAIAFIIFAGCTFSLQANSIGATLQQSLGADVVFRAVSIDTPLDEQLLTHYLQRDMSFPNTTVLGFTYVTFPMAAIAPMTDIRFSSLSGYDLMSVDLFATQENYLDVAYDNYYTLRRYDARMQYDWAGGQRDVVRSLTSHAGQALLPFETGPYVPSRVSTGPVPLGLETQKNVSASDIYQNYVDLVFSESLVNTESLDVSMPMRLVISSMHNMTYGVETHYLGKPRGVLSKLGGFGFSSYSLLSPRTPVLVNMAQYLRILKTVDEMREFPTMQYVNQTSIPKERLLLRMKPGLSANDRQLLIAALSSLLPEDSASVTDTLVQVESTNSSFALLNYFFILVAVIATALSFFILWLSFTANIRENSWEFGVLRSLGLSAGQVVRTYVYEALSLIFASVLIGATVGISVAITLTLQYNLFTELPFVFAFPLELFVAVVGMSLAVAVLGSYLPAKAVTKRAVALVLRGL